MTTRMTVVLALSLSLFGCKKKQAATGEPPAAGDKATKPEAAPAQFRKLGALPLEAEVAADANIDDNTKTAGFPSVSIYASPTTFVTGAGETSEIKATIEETKAELAKDPNKLKAFTREEKTADGWILELTRDDMMEPGKELHGVWVRRTLGGKPYDCGTNGRSKDEQAKAEKLCLSLREAK